ncbi:MAG TPA: hypothetical protein VKP64_00795 [Mycobacteriales bacterium]|nr:hypothetical protein [Mycobacteriales bacterium]
MRGSDRRAYARDVEGGLPRGGWRHLGGLLATAPVAVQAAGSERVDVLANAVDGELVVVTRTGGALSRWAVTG